MEKRKWLWNKRKSSERSSGETESSGSISSHSERFSDDQDVLKSSPNNDSQSPEVTSKTIAINEDVNDGIKNLTERLSAALVNVSAKDDLVKQHAKVAEEAVAGWEKAENEAAAFKKQLEAAVQKNSTLEDRVTHLDGALKECVRQLRLAKEEQEEKINDAVEKRTNELKSSKSELESLLTELKLKAETERIQSPSQIDSDIWHKLEYLEQENASLRLELLSQSEELEVRTIERDLSTHAAETASKQHLESIKKVAKLEAECRRLKALTYRSPSLNDPKTSGASSIYVESLTDSQSDSGDKHSGVDVDARKTSCSELNKGEPSCSDSWASALIAELGQFKNDRSASRNLPASSIEIDLMDDFLEMERLAALPEAKTNHSEQDTVAKQSADEENMLRAEFETLIGHASVLEEKLQNMERGKFESESEWEEKLQNMGREKIELEYEWEEKLQNMEREKIELESEWEEKLQNMEREKIELESELEEKLQKMEIEKIELQEKLLKVEEEKIELEEKLEKMHEERAELEMALEESHDKYEASELQLRDTQKKLEELQEELSVKNDAKQQIESQIISMEAEVRTMSAKVSSLEAEVEKERAISKESAVACQKLEEELGKKNQEIVLQQSASLSCEPKIKQEDLEVAAGKLAECQKTIASLGQQLKSLATLEDFLIDTSSMPGLTSGAQAIAKDNGAMWKFHSNDTFSPKRESTSVVTNDNSAPSLHKSEESTPPSAASSTVSTGHTGSDHKNRNGFAKFFSRSKNGLQLEI